MKGFVFSLQALLTLRQRQERLALEEYGQALQKRALASAALQQAQIALAGAWDRFRTDLQAACYAAHAASYRAQCAVLEDRNRQARAEVESAEQAVRHTLSLFTEARRHREAVDRLRDRRQRAFERVQTRQEVRVLDDLAGRGSRPKLSGPTTPYL